MRVWLWPLLLALAVAGALAQTGAPKAMVLQATAYTSSARETDRTPFVTATGMRTRLGVLAVSPDLLKVLLRDQGALGGPGFGLRPGPGAV